MARSFGSPANRQNIEHTTNITFICYLMLSILLPCIRLILLSRDNNQQQRLPHFRLCCSSGFSSCVQFWTVQLLTVWSGVSDVWEICNNSVKSEKHSNSSEEARPRERECYCKVPKEKALKIDKNSSGIEFFTWYHGWKIYLGNTTAGVSFHAVGGAFYLRNCTMGGMEPLCAFWRSGLGVWV